ncbi:MAG: TauD/TfdA family dioxygenase [Burkholderiaceae bacterium]
MPEQGGDTEFADMRHAWDRLAPAMQAAVLDMVAGHSLVYSRARLGFDGFSDEDRARYQPVRHRLVRRHPRSQRLSLYLAAHIGTIEGLPRPEAMVLIDELIEHATRREYVYRHRWQQGDLVIWDNRCTMHRATAFDDRHEPRDLRRVTVQDDLPTLEQPR